MCAAIQHRPTHIVHSKFKKNAFVSCVCVWGRGWWGVRLAFVFHHTYTVYAINPSVHKSILKCKMTFDHSDLPRRWQVILKELSPSQPRPIWLSALHAHTKESWLTSSHKQATRRSDPDLLQLMVSTLWGPVYNIHWQKASLLLIRQLSCFLHRPGSHFLSTTHTHTQLHDKCRGSLIVFITTAECCICSGQHSGVTVWRYVGVKKITFIMH